MTPILLAATALVCVVVAVGAALEGNFTFTGARWTPGEPPAEVMTPTPVPTQTVVPKPTATPQPLHPAVVFNMAPIVIIATIAIVVMIVLLVRMFLRRRPRAVAARQPGGISILSDELDAVADTPADVPTILRGLDFASEVLSSRREPTDAIVRAWIGLQEAAEDSGMSRRPAETPTEFTARVLDSVHADRAAARALLAIYLRVRFGSRPATDDDVRNALDAIGKLQSTWEVERVR
jgi:hypothetical protein